VPNLALTRALRDLFDEYGVGCQFQGILDTMFVPRQMRKFCQACEPTSLAVIGQTNSSRLACREWVLNIYLGKVTRPGLVTLRLALALEACLEDALQSVPSL